MVDDVNSLRDKGYYLLPLPVRQKEPPPRAWITSSKPYEVPPEGNVAIGVRGEAAILITNDEQSTKWATERFGDPNVLSVRGAHWYFAPPEGQANERNLPTAVGAMELHVRNKYALVPPSIHPSGAEYRWKRELPRLAELPPLPDLRELWHPSGEHHAKLVSISAAAAHAGKNSAEVLAALRSYRDGHLPDPEVHPDRELEQLAESAVSKFGGSSRGAPARIPKAPPRLKDQPPLDEFDPVLGEVFEASDDRGNPDIGVAWVEGGSLWRTTLSAEMRRLAKEYESAEGPGRRDKQAEAEHQRKVERLVLSLPFARVKDALWPLPEDPTLCSTEEWESANGTLLESLRSYFEKRVCVGDPDGHLLMALWAMGASARSDQVDFAPRIMFQAAYGWGKSSSAESLQLVIPRSVYGAAVSPAAAHRVMNEWHPVLLVDESAIADNPELQRVLRAGFKRGAKIIRAAQNQDRGVVTIDPFGWVILTTQVDTKDDLINRCYVLFLNPGSPALRVSLRDPDSRRLRTALARMRLDILLGDQYPDIAAQAEAAQAAPGLELRSRDKLTALWPFAVRYSVQKQLVSVAARLEEDATHQLANSDKGLVATAVGALVASVGGISALKAGDLELSRIQEHLQQLLIQMGEATVIPVGGGETAFRVDLKRWGPRDFTAPMIRELGLKLKTVSGRSRIDHNHFLSVWPSISARYSGQSTLDVYGDPPSPPGGGVVIPPIPPQMVGYPTESGGVVVGSPGPEISEVVVDRDGRVVGSVGSGRGYEAPSPAAAGRTDKPADGAPPELPDWYLWYFDGTIRSRLSGDVLWKPGDDPAKKPRKGDY
ncbi:MAG: bifunctional DNA primase/polymerase [Thermoplasmata archaeon]|nr:bifunctional DNA primase/polymerase [Thermoplasmata archaeon]